MKKFEFVLLSLATWRIATMLVKEDGPWMVFEHLRLKVGLMPPQHPASQRYTNPPGAMPGSIFACTWCFSVYVGTLFALLFGLNRKMAVWLSMPFALSSIACVIDRWDNWSDR